MARAAGCVVASTGHIGMVEPTVERIVRRTRFVNGKLMEHSDVFISYRGRAYYTRYWWLLTDTPQVRAMEAQSFKKRIGALNFAEAA